MMANDLRLALLVMENKRREAEGYTLTRHSTAKQVRGNRDGLKVLVNHLQHRLGGLLIVAGQWLLRQEAIQA
jgi:hypothetical protein